ncbi:Hypothetical_protein [Hexamita inflata]|uniref:Hypothetical_protein n=1 Tax=Hexamita inflata TaxID=28002 RepID=A0AA86QZV5_9EUKA|nr:Hypothetical protein HINF_LOCUS47890 [Hexamita inflata]
MAGPPLQMKKDPLICGFLQYKGLLCDGTPLQVQPSIAIFLLHNKGFLLSGTIEYNKVQDNSELQYNSELYFIASGIFNKYIHKKLIYPHTIEENCKQKQQK